MFVRPDEFPAGPSDSGLSAVRHRTTCLARWLRLPGTAVTPDYLSIRYWRRPDTMSPTRSRRTPVLLVHGYAGTEHMWHPLRTALADAGFDQIIALRYNTFRGDIHRVADWLVEQAHRTMATCEADGVHLIGHSMGGLVVRDAVQSRGLGDLARTAVTLATPHNGSAFARFAPGPCARQMLPGSAFLRDLASHHDRGATRWIDIQGEADWVVAPGPAPAGADVLRVSHPSGHRSITRHPDVIARIVDELALMDDRTAARAREFSLAA